MAKFNPKIVAELRFPMRHDFHNIKTLSLFAIFLGLTICGGAHGKVLFEGYSQILLDSKPSGYVVQRYEYNRPQKELVSRYYIQTSRYLGNKKESLLAKCTEDFKPLFYRYTDKSFHHQRTIEAHFQNNTMKGYIFDGKNKTSFQKELPTGTFLSTFLNYLMLNKGYKKGVKFVFSAISEEDGKISHGESYIKEVLQKHDVKAFRVFNKFKGSQFTSLLDSQGAVLQTNSPLQKISTRLTSFQQATKGLPIDRAALKALFGEIPRGLTNVYAQDMTQSIK